MQRVIMGVIQEVLDSARMHFNLFGIRGVVRRAIIRLPRSSIQFSAPIPNSSARVLLRLGTTDVAAFEHVFVKDEYDITLSEEPSVVIDAGANVGMSAIYFSNRYPNAKVIAIEPEPSNFSMLKSNAELYPRIIPVNAALWNRDGVVSLKDGESGSWGMRVSEPVRSSDAFVRSVTVPTLLREYGIDKVDLLKIDIEGAECEALENAPVWIDRVRVVCAELHDRLRPGCTEAFKFATDGFPVRWQRGELSCVAREGAVLFNRIRNSAGC
jgi:FkbM family methyltransferase